MFTNRPAMNQASPSLVQKHAEVTFELEDDFVMIRDAVQKDLLDNTKNDASMNPDKLKELIEECFNRVLEDENFLYNHDTRNQMLDWVIADIVGYGPIEPLLNDPDITEIMVNG